VVVKYADCQMEVLKRCTVKGAPAYDYIGLTPKHDTVTMRDASEVYANIPVYAAKFEGKLQQSGALEVAMTVVGQFDTARPVARQDELEGDCSGATHVVTALTVGSFQFFATNATEQSAGVEVSPIQPGRDGLSETDDAVVTEAGHALPDVARLVVTADTRQCGVVATEHGHAQARGVDAVDLGEQLPGEVDGDAGTGADLRIDGLGRSERAQRALRAARP